MANPSLLRGRFSQIDACYTVTSVVRDRQPLLLLPGNTEILCKQWHCIEQEGRVLTHAWVVMPDHVHWLFQLQKGSLGQCMQRFKSRSAQAINGYMGRSGQFWQTGYYDHHLRSEVDLLNQARYLVENPLRKGLVTRIEDYPAWWCRWISGSHDLC